MTTANMVIGDWFCSSFLKSTDRLCCLMLKNRLERIEKFVASVYAPMFLMVHLKPPASDGPENPIF